MLYSLLDSARSDKKLHSALDICQINRVKIRKNARVSSTERTSLITFSGAFIIPDSRRAGDTVRVAISKAIKNGIITGKTYSAKANISKAVDNTPTDISEY